MKMLGFHMRRWASGSGWMKSSQHGGWSLLNIGQCGHPEWWDPSSECSSISRTISVMCHQKYQCWLQQHWRKTTLPFLRFVSVEMHPNSNTNIPTLIQEEINITFQDTHNLTLNSMFIAFVGYLHVLYSCIKCITPALSVIFLNLTCPNCLSV